MENLVDLPLASAQSHETGKTKLRILVTGADGYIGCILSSRLLEAGHDVHGVDTGYYQGGWLYHDGRDRPRILCRDIRNLSVEDLRHYDAVVHLAELSNDPLCDLDEESTYKVNYHGSVALATKAKGAGVGRFVYSSSCSVYGAAGDDERTESSPVGPQTAYARCKVLVENAVGKLSDATFAPTFLRNATAFGASPRMRFDLVLNNLSAWAWTTRSIRMTSDGTPWRPLVHVEDICAAIIGTLEAPSDSVRGQIFNVGDDRQNYRVREIADVVAEIFVGCSLEMGTSGGDNRSYRVSFRKITEMLPAFRCRWDLTRGAKQLRTIFESVGLDEGLFNARPYTRLRQLRHLLESEQIDSDLFWRPLSAAAAS